MPLWSPLSGMNRPSLYVCLASLCIVLGGCSERKESVVAPASAPEATLAVESIVADGETKETARLWSDPIKALLLEIEEAMLTEDGMPASLGEGTIAMPDVARAEATEAFQDQTVKVVEMAFPADLVKVEANEVLSSLRQLLSLEAGDDEHGAHFKLYGISREGADLKTRQRLTAKGARDGKKVRSYVVVDALWRLPEADDGTPLLVSFSMQTLMQAELADTGFQFDDIGRQCSMEGATPARHEYLASTHRSITEPRLSGVPWDCHGGRGWGWFRGCVSLSAWWAAESLVPTAGGWHAGRYFKSFAGGLVRQFHGGLARGS